MSSTVAIEFAALLHERELVRGERVGIVLSVRNVETVVFVRGLGGASA